MRDPVPTSGHVRLETIRVSQVPGAPWCVYALFFDPGGTEPPGLTVIRRGPRDVQDEGSPRVNQISGLNGTALTLAVYASQWLLPAPTQDSLPAAGQLYRVGLSTHRVPTKGFHDASYIASSSPKLLGARTY